MSQKKRTQRIVIISHYTFPIQSPRANRTHELACELVRLGHDVTLYVMPSDDGYTEYQKETGIRVRSLGRMRIYRGGLDATNSNGYIKRGILKVLRKLIEFPQIELMWRVFKALKYERDFELLISIAVPYPLHWGVALYRSVKSTQARRFTWVADCGDPYMGNPFSKKLFYFKFVERWFCRKADFLTVPTESAKQGYYKEFRDKMVVIPQGFKFSGIKLKNYVHNNRPKFIYAGNFYSKYRDPRPFLDYLLTLKSGYRFIVYTRSSGILNEYIGKLGECLEVRDYVSREELIYTCSGADFLINFENSSNVQTPSKLIDYSLSGRPVLNISDFNTFEKERFHEFLNGEYNHDSRIRDLTPYDIRSVANRFAKLTKSN